MKTSKRIVLTSDSEESDDPISPLQQPPLLPLFPHPHGAPKTPLRRSSFSLSSLSSNSQRRAQSLPPLEYSEGFNPSSPYVGEKAARQAKKKAKGQQQEQAKAEEATAQRSRLLDPILAALTRHGLTIGDLMSYVFDPRNKQGKHCWTGFFRFKGMATQILDSWVSKKNSSTGRNEVHNWAISYIQRIVKREARTITKSGYLQSRNKPINAQYFLDFDFHKIYQHLREVATVATSIFEAFSISLKQSRSMSDARKATKEKVLSSITLQGLGKYSQANNWGRRVMSVYLYATGAQRQAICVASHVGISESYSSIVCKKRTNDSETEEWQEGSLRRLSNSMRSVTRTIAATGLFAVAYDNINMMFKVAEQLIGRNSSQENGTCATLFPLWKARTKDMLVSDLEKSFDTARNLSIDDIMLHPEEAFTLKRCLIHCILRIIVDHGGEPFTRFRKDLENSRISTDTQIELHKTPLHPLPAMNIDESTIIGNGEVVEAVLDELGVKDSPWQAKHTKIFAGDQLSIARLRTLANIRAGQEGGFAGFSWGIWMPGLFHAKMADMHGILVTHWGKPNTGTRNPGSLSFHNTRLHRNLIILSSLPPFRTCRDLVFVSLYARILHCLELVCRKSSLAECAEVAENFEDLVKMAEEIYEHFTNPDIVSDLRWKRRKACEKDANAKEGDMVFENAVLFLRDALISREFTDAIKAGDSGRVVLILKVFALSYRGNGRTKYAYEMLNFIHNLSNVWPKTIRSIVLNNWLLNPTGRPNSFVEVDLMQEHMNFWIKNIYKAHGSAASWEWLETTAPCVDVLRHLSKIVNSQLGSHSGTTHQALDLSRDIPVLMSSLRDHDVYKQKIGRHLDNDDPPVPDIVTLGLQMLTDTNGSNPVTEFNQGFARLQARRRLTPVVSPSLPVNPTSASASERIPSKPIAPHTTNPDSTEATNPSPAHPPTDIVTNEHQKSPGPAYDATDIEPEALELEDAEEPGDFERSADESMEQTLTLDNPEDVSLDMDTEDACFYESDKDDNETEPLMESDDSDGCDSDSASSECDSEIAGTSYSRDKSDVD
ncbi:hypothetical protein BJ138DRAFT_1013701 [Hygrophoropsis aurantiaca]|uniref:Uncharacterized protein n=1 Tax=Hygrophoropsis aurantiaca TaxID=72124 RepID=A0ACB8A3M2_9AGAM|nr:hypothetical protein BJ138DRAFT_1013701 [Hygrophoropsis aurantiaca]